jgi:hypothetical protein
LLHFVCNMFAFGSHEKERLPNLDYVSIGSENRKLLYLPKHVA